MPHRSSPNRLACTENGNWLNVLVAPAAEQVRELTARGLPPVGLLFLQNACESRCFFCASPGVTSPPADAITGHEHVRAWIAAARDVPMERICIGGTEPALHGSFEDALAALAPRGIPIEVMTSGLRLGELGAAQRWHALGVRAVAVPLYSNEPARHDAIVGTGSAFARVTRGLDAARALGIEVRVHTLALARTLADLPELAAMTRSRWGARLGIGLARPKEGVWSWHDEAATHAALERAIEGVDVSLIGFPLCVGRQAPREAATVIDYYFRTTTTGFADACEGCADRPRCPGVLATELARGVTVRPR